MCGLLAQPDQRVHSCVQAPLQCTEQSHLGAASTALQSQLTLDSFVATSQRFAKIKSKRLQKVGSSGGRRVASAHDTRVSQMGRVGEAMS